ncbi:hypothetical protein A2Y85_02070 [candidate division WOR-3 bacterium RBG_13_43_14]|uniref:Uncharacterized protein n=1 Tax=candidate division WOR-3 bacterium RBG_13_43_14 TaxID=1802590 RepID=A0A1F4U8Z4_UNCW3|nr:MAG: hypothetical protein A2Y85_02070 [candidate division WOR-3 bacterium RBG_13_43_14]
MTILILFKIFSLTAADSTYADSSGTDYYEASNVLRFADHLYQEKDYFRAAGEYYRYLFSFDTFPPNTDSIYYRIGACFKKGGNYSKASDFFMKSAQLSHDPSFISSANFNISKSYSLISNYERSNEFIGRHIREDDDPVQKKMRQLRVANYLYTARWQQAADLLRSEIDTDTITNLLRRFTNEGLTLPHKSAVLAGVFSTIIPGSGKLYTNRFYEGMQSFFTVGIMGWQSCDGFKSSGISSFKGWAFGVVGGLFYLGNIYGSIVAAEIYNEEIENKHIEKIRVYVNIDIDY